MGLIEWREERDGLYGVVEWINGNPILDGMPYFKGKDAAIKYAIERESMGNMSILGITDLKYTIIRLTKAESAGLVQRPESCGKCGDSGTKKMWPPVGRKALMTCPCTKDPNSLYNFIKEIKGG